MKIRVLQDMDKITASKIVHDCSSGMSLYEVCSKYNITEDQLYRITKKFKGTYNDAQRRDSYNKKLARVEKKLKEREEEVKLLRVALKKY